MRIDKSDRDYINHLPEGTFLEYKGKLCVVVTERKFDKGRKNNGKRDCRVQGYPYRGQ